MLLRLALPGDLNGAPHLNEAWGNVANNDAKRKITPVLFTVRIPDTSYQYLLLKYKLKPLCNAAVSYCATGSNC